MPRRARVVKETGAAVLALLRLTSATADVFPPLKSAAGGALHIAEIVVVHISLYNLSVSVLIIIEQQFKSNQKQWADFAQYIKDTLACIIQLLPDVNQPRGDLVQNMEKLNK
jgi:hypothetical protein